MTAPATIPPREHGYVVCCGGCGDPMDSDRLTEWRGDDPVTFGQRTWWLCARCLVDARREALIGGGA